MHTRFKKCIQIFSLRKVKTDCQTGLPGVPKKMSMIGEGGKMSLPDQSGKKNICKAVKIITVMAESTQQSDLTCAREQRAKTSGVEHVTHN